MSEKILKPPYPQDILPRQGWVVPIATADLLKDCPNLLLGHMLRGGVDQCIVMKVGADILGVMLFLGLIFPNFIFPLSTR